MRSLIRFAFRRTASIAALIALALTLALAGCGRTSDNESSGSASGNGPTSGTGGGDFKVSLVMSGPTSDNGWNAGAYKGLLEVRKDLNLSEADSPYVENKTAASDQAKNLRDFASKGFNIVFGHGNEYEKPAIEMANDFPKTLFVISSGDPVSGKVKNVTSIILNLEDGAYLLGMLAGGMSQTGKLAEVGADEIAPVKSVFAAFEAGARAVNPKVEILPAAWTHSWEDANKAKEATLPLIDRGADVLIQDLDAGADGVFEAVKLRNSPSHPVYALGTNNDQNAEAPDVILASAPIYIAKAFVPIARQVKAGTFQPGDTSWDMKSGVIGFVLNPNLESRIPSPLRKRLEETQQKITAGSFLVPKGSG